MGLLIDSEEMVESLTEDKGKELTSFFYRVRENNKGKLEWHGRINNLEVIETREPLTSWWLRLKAWFMNIAPESQL